MKKNILFLFVFIFMMLACDLTVTVEPNFDDAVSVPIDIEVSEDATPALVSDLLTVVPTTVPATRPPTYPTVAVPTYTAVSQPTSATSTEATFGQLSMIIPADVATGASGREYPRVDGENAAYWQKTPGHLQVSLRDYYILGGKFQEPQIYVYPAEAYAEMVPAAFESIRRINDILADPNRANNKELLPSIPFFNAKQAFASNIEVIHFQNGSGIRFLTQYAQYAAPINNYELFYHFQGITRGGKYYIVAIFPISAPVLAETADPAAPIPSGGIEYRDMGDPKADFPVYYASVSQLLGATSNDIFSPSINQLDLLIQSINIAQ